MKESVQRRLESRLICSEQAANQHAFNEQGTVPESKRSGRFYKFSSVEGNPAVIVVTAPASGTGGGSWFE